MRPDQPEADEPDGARAEGARAEGARADAHRSLAADDAAPPADRGDQGDQGDRDTAATEGDRSRTTPPSRAEQLAEHDRLRRSIENSGTAADQQDAWVTAARSLRATWEQHKERYPDQARAVPVTGEDGSWACGRHRRLDPEQNTEATKAHADLADEASRHILPALRRIEAADPDRKLAGLEHMVKGEDRLKEKVADVLLVEPELSPRQALGKVPDAVRFTLTYGSERYTESVLGDVDRLKSEGYEEIKLKNLWHTMQYKGINSQWRSPETGTRFEVQFHTESSHEAKELTHEAYERLRRPESETSQAERGELQDFQTRVNGLVASPYGVDNILDFPEKRR